MNLGRGVKNREPLNRLVAGLFETDIRRNSQGSGYQRCLDQTGIDLKRDLILSSQPTKNWTSKERFSPKILKRSHQKFHKPLSESPGRIKAPNRGGE